MATLMKVFSTNSSTQVDNAYQEPLLILSDLYRQEEDYESLIGLLKYVDEDLDPVFMWHLAYALGQKNVIRSTAFL